MRMRAVLGSGLAALVMLGGAASAENRAVGIVQAEYQGIASTAAPDANALFARFRDAGYGTASGISLSREDMVRALATLQQPDAAPGKRIVVLTGRFMKGQQDSYLMQPATDAPGLARAAEQGVALSQVIDLMQDGGPMNVLLLGDASGQLRPGLRLANGIGPLGMTGQRVTVLTGTPAAVARAAEVLLRPNATVAEALAVHSSMRQLAGPPARPAVASPGPAVVTPSPEAPVTSTPQLREAQLNLSRTERGQVQRALTVLGYDTRGVDGVFGSGTRAAITRWQRDSRLPETGHLDARTLQMLRDAAAQAEARSPERARDQAYWEDVAQPGGVAGMRAYLERYPNGIHAAEARRAIGAATTQTDTAAYQRALNANTIAEWRAYLDRHGNSPNAAEARRRLAALEAAQRDAAAEAALGLPAAVRQMVEQRLAQMGLDPGRVDGTFDADTRRAIRQYQRDGNLPVTGYLDETMMVRMLADSIFGG
ncbi:peptidoglycan-binding domain-containing protein [Paracoccus sp. S-4012]|uniref:peptidoglycan-binding domain-containing protein n=1 Tax=Paracoccus sp. S-4012 TaxID=2665648 RepID=UPI0018A1D2D3|nr:peptidoglycan-binding domain-containing protein [Paracoccus sp. S-4012]